MNNNVFTVFFSLSVNILLASHSYTADMMHSPDNIEILDPTFLPTLQNEIETVKLTYPSIYGILTAQSNTQGARYLNSFVLKKKKQKPLCLYALEKIITAVQESDVKSVEHDRSRAQKDHYEHLIFMIETLFNIDMNASKPRHFLIYETPLKKPALSISQKLYDQLQKTVQKARTFTMPIDHLMKADIGPTAYDCMYEEESENQELFDIYMKKIETVQKQYHTTIDRINAIITTVYTLHHANMPSEGSVQKE